VSGRKEGSPLRESPPKISTKKEKLKVKVWLTERFMKTSDEENEHLNTAADQMNAWEQAGKEVFIQINSLDQDEKRR